MALTYGTEGIKQKDYRVYLDATSAADVASFLATYNAAKNQSNINALIATLDELGECRADSITVTGENGDTIEGNVLGEIVLNKACAMAAELINATAANITRLVSLDGVPVTIVIIEKDTHPKSVGGNAKTAIVISDVVLSYSENITGGDSIRAMVNISKSVPSITDFRSITDITWT
jgi:hypothetical protein